LGGGNLLRYGDGDERHTGDDLANDVGPIHTLEKAPDFAPPYALRNRCAIRR
jgi:hypothetical protein